MLNSKQLRNLIIKPTLQELAMYSEEAEELLVFTCAVESLGGTFLKQLNGPALGIYQMEPETYNDLWQNYIYNKPNILLILTSQFSNYNMPPEDKLIYDLRFATVMTRLFYLRIKEALPPKDNVELIYAYYKKYYNTSKGAANFPDSYRKYENFIKA